MKNYEPPKLMKVSIESTEAFTAYCIATEGYTVVSGTGCISNYYNYPTGLGGVSYQCFTGDMD